MEGPLIPVEEGHVVASDDGLVLLVLGRDDSRGSADQWRCLVLGDFFEGAGALPHEPGHVELFSIRADMAWQRVAP
jgi:hypothetical protein